MDELYITPDPDPGFGSPPAKRPLKKLIIALAALAALALCLGLVFMLAAGPKEPRDGLRAAFAATEKSNQKANEAIYKAIPSLGLLAKANGWPAADFDTTLTFKGLSGTGDDQQINAMLGGASMAYSIQRDSEGSAAQATAMLTLLGREFLGIYGYSSPEALALGLPGLTDTVLSINPNTLSQDYAASPWYDPYTAESIDAMAAALRTQVQLAATPSGVLPEPYQALWDTLLDAGNYGAEDNAYTVTLPGEAVRTFILETAWALMGQSLADEYTREEFFTEGAAAIPPIPVTAVFRVYGDVLTEIRVATPAITIEDADIYGLELQVTANLSDDVSHANLSLTWLDWADDTCGLELSITEDGSSHDGRTFLVAGWLSDGYDTYDFDLTCSFMPDDTFSLVLNAVNDYDEGLSLTASGSITEQGGAVVVDIPDLALTVDDGYDVITFNLSVSQKTTRLTGSLAPSRAFTPFFSLTDADLEALVREIAASFEELFGAFYGY